MIKQVTSIYSDIQVEIDRLNRTSDVQYEVVPGSYQSAKQAQGGVVYSASIRPQTVRETKLIQSASVDVLNKQLIDGWQVVTKSVQKIGTIYTVLVEREVIVKKESETPQ